MYFDAIIAQLNEGIIDKKTGKVFDLSQVDKRIIACALANNYKITTGDNGLINYYLQEFSNNPDEIVSPLELINSWLEQKLIVWAQALQTILEDWTKCGEAQQPRIEIRKFEKLTGYKYPGS